MDPDMPVSDESQAQEWKENFVAPHLLRSWLVLRICLSVCVCLIESKSESSRELKLKLKSRELKKRTDSHSESNRRSLSSSCPAQFSSQQLSCSEVFLLKSFSFVVC